MPAPQPPPEDPPAAAAIVIPQLRFLRRLVTGLALVMGAGIIAIVALMWLRLTPAPAAIDVLPEGLTLPQGTEAEAVTMARDWIIVVTQTGEVLVFDRAGTLTQRMMLRAP